MPVVAILSLMVVNISVYHDAILAAMSLALPRLLLPSALLCSGLFASSVCLDVSVSSLIRPSIIAALGAENDDLSASNLAISASKTACHLASLINI